MLLNEKVVYGHSSVMGSCVSACCNFRAYPRQLLSTHAIDIHFGVFVLAFFNDMRSFLSPSAHRRNALYCSARWHAPMWVIIWSPIFIFDFTWLLCAVASSCIWCSSTRFVMQCFGLWTGAALVIYCFSSSPWIVCGSYVYVLIGTWGWGPLCC